VAVEQPRVSGNELALFLLRKGNIEAIKLPMRAWVAI
jgi:hypothetical protein